MAEQTGLMGALAGAVAAAGEIDQSEQMELIAQLPLLKEVTIEGKKFGPGRPKGSMNKATKDLAEYILERHRHPVIAAAQICDMPLYLLREQLQCDMLEAAKYQQTCREFVARYTLQQMPQAVDVKVGIDGKLFVIGLDSRGGSELTQVNPFALDLKPVQQNQEVTTLEPVKSHDEKSHNEPNQ
jgi:hypothetical protein